MIRTLLILSGGTGTRFDKNLPKQYHKDPNGKTVFQRSVENFDPKDFHNVAVVCNKEYKSLINGILESMGFLNILFSDQGENRQMSINNGVRAIIDAGIKGGQLFIQESVRPFVSKKMINDLISVPDEFVNVSPAVNPIVLYGKGNKDEITELIQKEQLFELQLPKRYDLLMFKEFLIDEDVNTHLTLDESEYFIYKGFPIKTICGDNSNIKITFIKDKNIL